jgi:hypothetical protein
LAKAYGEWMEDKIKEPAVELEVGSFRIDEQQRRGDIWHSFFSFFFFSVVTQKRQMDIIPNGHNRKNHSIPLISSK